MIPTSSILLSSLACLLAASNVAADGYTIHQVNVGKDFLSNFELETPDNPLGGAVNYTDETTAASSNLTYADGDTFIMRVDNTTVISNSSDVGRRSVRIKSLAQYTEHLAVFDIRHLPVGCGTWPALWEYDDNVGVANGEFDILEGINSQTPGYTTIHTGGNCTLSANRTQTGDALGNDCSSTTVQQGGDNGCSVSSPYASSFGPVFNDNGGGWYVAERTSSALSVWFWARNDSTVPEDVSSGADTLNTTGWTTPLAFFPASSTCDFETNFKELNIIIDTSLCGSWAGEQFSASGCPGNCIDFVNSNPSNFTDAYWNFAAARIYLPS